MAQGVGVGQWNLASPDFPQGPADYASIIGDGVSSPFVGGPNDGGDPSTIEEASGVGPVHVSTGRNGVGSSIAGRAQHWSNLFDPSGPLLYLMVATLLYFGLVSLHVGARAGRFRIGAGSGR
jgi:hypothetical protein